MTFKNTMTINKPLFHGEFSGFSPAGLIAKLKSALTFEIPTGFQDETGFHEGVERDESEIQWPATW
jgi:hypothetical protein